jgi:hypothetical protein
VQEAAGLTLLLGGCSINGIDSFGCSLWKVSGLLQTHRQTNHDYSLANQGHNVQVSVQKFLALGTACSGMQEVGKTFATLPG